MPVPRSFRLALFLERIVSLPYAASLIEARNQIESTLNAVEDEFSGVPFDPSQWAMDGRMYPPEEDFAFPVDDHPEVTLFRTRKHRIYIRVNGAIRVETSGGELVVAKRGADGQEVFGPA